MVYGRQAVWQWSVDVHNSKDNTGYVKAFLLIPEYCRKLKAVIISQKNVEEQSILENRRFRKAMAKMDIAEIWISRPLTLP